MTGHPQGSNRGVRALASVVVANSTGTATLGVNSTGLTLDGGVRLKNSTGQIRANSTSLIINTGSVQIKNSTGVITVNSTAVKVAKQLEVGTKATFFNSNSTGVKLGTKYITGNSTGN